MNDKIEKKNIQKLIKVYVYSYNTYSTNKIMKKVIDLNFLLTKPYLHLCNIAVI